MLPQSRLHPALDRYQSEARRRGGSGMSPSSMKWTGRVLSGLFAIFMLGASAAPKLLGMPVAEQTLGVLGWPHGYAVMIGLIELGCVILYLVPSTSLLGAVLTMSLLGGAIATQIRAGSPLFSHILFGIYLGLFMWAGLWLRDPKLRSMFPRRRRNGGAIPPSEGRGAAEARGALDGGAGDPSLHP
jgi:hypothetical protein